MEFRILGPLEVVDGGTVVPIPGAKERGVLAFLLLHANEFVPSDRLIEELWSGEPPTSARKSLQVRVANLRKALGAGGDVLVTRGPGYVLRLERDQLDLHRFERLVASSDAVELHLVVDRLRAALDLWRGEPLADLGYEGFVQGPAARLAEIRLNAVEKRIGAELELGLHGDLVRELQALVAEHPLREGLRGQLMLALYRAGRQAEALDAYRDARSALNEELGLEPGPALQRLERAILSHDSSLDLESPQSARDDAPPLAIAAGRSILVVIPSPHEADALLAVAEPIALRSGREIIVMCAISDARVLTETAMALDELRESLLSRGVTTRAAAFTSRSPAHDLVRAVAEQDVDLILVRAPPDLLDDEALRIVLTRAGCDVGVLAVRAGRVTDGPVVVPFTGTDHDWTAVELGSRLSGKERVLRLVGSAGDASGGRDASRIIASASLAVQGALGIAAEPVLIEPGVDGLLAAADEAAFVVLGLPERWASVGLGEARRALTLHSSCPVLLTRRGLRPGVLAPPESMTQFTWTLRAG
jgi:DNA-binding SARP family transcriptional activator